MLRYIFLLRILDIEPTLSVKQPFIFILCICFSISKQMGEPLLGLRNSKSNTTLKLLGKGNHLTQSLTRYIGLV